MINIIDIEASGLHFDSYPIEVAVLIAGNIKSWIIKPEPSWQYWSKVAEGMHGLSRDTLESEGVSAAQVIKELGAFIKNSNDVIYSDAVYWDADWIDTLYHAVKETRRFDIKSIYELLDGDKGAKFDEVKANLAASGKYRHHRAGEDVKIIAEAFEISSR